MYIYIYIYNIHFAYIHEADLKISKQMGALFFCSAAVGGDELCTCSKAEVELLQVDIMPDNNNNNNESTNCKENMYMYNIYVYTCCITSTWIQF